VSGLVKASPHSHEIIDLEGDKVLVTTGFIEGDGLENARVSEVIDVINTGDVCSNLDKAPTQRWASVGGVVNGRPLICGGFNGVQSFKDCFYIEGEPAQNLSMTRIRSFATSAVMTDPATRREYLWVVGGFEKEDLSTTEFVHTDKAAVEGPTLDFPIAHHCMVQVDDKAIYIVGGKQDGEISNKVWVVDPTDDFKVIEGPSLKEKRYFHSCAAMEDTKTGAKMIVVAGGFGPEQKGSVEILNTTSPINEWQKGPELPSANLFAGQMVTKPGTQNKAVLAVAGNTLYSLSSEDIEWKRSEKYIQYGRMMPVVLSIPGTLVSCK